jgi:hypothetical protein
VKKRVLTLAVVSVLISACAEIPAGPSVSVMPPPGKPFEVFAADDQTCRSYAQQSVGTNPNLASAESLAGSAVLGTALGAAAGALVGGHASAGVGAGLGAVAGTAMGVNAASYAGQQTQQRYDTVYMQCMYARGNVLPGEQATAEYLPPPPAR